MLDAVLCAADDDYRSSMGWQFGDTGQDNMNEHVFWYTGLGRTVSFFEERRFRDMFHKFGIHPDTAFG